jgi:hypothetical protein
MNLEEEQKDMLGIKIKVKDLKQHFTPVIINGHQDVYLEVTLIKNKIWSDHSK